VPFWKILLEARVLNRLITGSPTTLVPLAIQMLMPPPNHEEHHDKNNNRYYTNPGPHYQSPLSFNFRTAVKLYYSRPFLTCKEGSYTLLVQGV